MLSRIAIEGLVYFGNPEIGSPMFKRKWNTYCNCQISIKQAGTSTASTHTFSDESCTTAASTFTTDDFGRAPVYYDTNELVDIVVSRDGEEIKKITNYSLAGGEFVVVESSTAPAVGTPNNVITIRTL